MSSIENTGHHDHSGLILMNFAANNRVTLQIIIVGLHSYPERIWISELTSVTISIYRSGSITACSHFPSTP